MPILELKQVGKIVCVGIKTNKKDDLFWIEAGRMRELKYSAEHRFFIQVLKQLRNIVYAGIEANKKDCLYKV